MSARFQPCAVAHAYSHACVLATTYTRRRRTPSTYLQACVLATVALLAACTATSSDSSARGTVSAPTRAPETFAVGRDATPQEIAAWDLDVNAKGEGLPPGEGSVAQGVVVYARACAACHGANGEGIPPNAKLVGRIPGDSFPFATDTKATKTIGSYWPYATTLFDYIRRAMPQNALGTLTASETYAVIAWLLHENAIVADNAVMNATTLPAVKMPSRNRFVIDNRTGGAGFK